MSKRILKEYGEKAITSEHNAFNLAHDLSIPVVKACQIVACFELGRRFCSEEGGKASFIRNANQAFDYFKDMSDLRKEHLRGIYLNSRYQVIHDEVISIGSLTSSVIHPREVFSPAFRYSAVGVILAHNHPSGSLRPTKTDLEITNLLNQAGKILGIDLLDHLIIAKNKYLSIIERSNYGNK